MRTAKMARVAVTGSLSGGLGVGVRSLGIFWGGSVFPTRSKRWLKLDTLGRLGGVESVRQDGDTTQEE